MFHELKYKIPENAHMHKSLILSNFVHKCVYILFVIISYLP